MYGVEYTFGDKVYFESCFSDFLFQRLNAIDLNLNNLLYRFESNLEIVEELVNWINSLYDNLSVTIIESKSIGKYFQYDLIRDKLPPGEIYTYRQFAKFKDWEWNYQRNTIYLINEKDFLPNLRANDTFELFERVRAFNEVKGIELSKILVEIKVKEESRFESKFLLEMLVMIIIRMLDWREDFFIKLKRDAEIINDIIQANSRNTNSGHCLFDNNWGMYHNSGQIPRVSLDLNLLKSALDINNIQGAINGNHIKNAIYTNYTDIKQTPLIRGVHFYLESKKEKN